MKTVKLHAVSTNTELLTESILKDIAENILHLEHYTIENITNGKEGHRIIQHRIYTDRLSVSFEQLAYIVLKYGIGSTNLYIVSPEQSSGYVEIDEFESTVIGNRKMANILAVQ